MPTMNISLTDQLKEYVENQVNSGRYTSASEYVRELVRTDQKRREKEEVESRLLEGLNSGAAMEISPAMWEDLRKNLRKRSRRAS
jgi:antitoxin ParD1/3/4